MKNIIKFLGIIVLAAVVGFAMVGCKDPTGGSDDDNLGNKTPVAADYYIDNLTQTTGNVTAVTVTAKAGKSSGTVTVYYEGTGDTTYAKSTTVPNAEGTYAVTFNVAAAEGWNAANGLSAGTLTISDDVDIPGNQTPVAADYTIGNLNQNTGSVTAVTVTKKDETKSPGTITIYYESTDGTSYSKSTNVPTAAGTYNVTFNVASATGWNAASGLSAGTLTINAFDPNLSTPKAEDYDITGDRTVTYDGNSHAISVVTKDTTKSSGAVTVLYNGNATAPTDAGEYTVTFNVAAVANEWNAGVDLAAGTLTIEKATGATVGAPTSATIGVISVTLQAITTLTPNTTGQSVEYAYSTGSTAPSSGWQEELSFSNLQPGTEYWFFARAKANDNYNTGVESSGTKITTDLPSLTGTIAISYTSLDISTSGSVTLTANYTGGTETITTYEWKNGESVVGSNTSTHTASAIGTYTVTVSANGFKPKTSESVEVINSTLPDLSSVGNITFTPNTGIQTGTAVTAAFNHTGGGAAPSISWQWYRDGAGAVSGATTATYTPLIAGTYYIVANATGYNALQSGNVTVTNRTPVAGDYSFSGTGTFTYASGTSRSVTVTPQSGKSQGARTVSYTGVSPTSYPKSTTAPTNAGTYTVTFDVAADTTNGWNAATNLAAGNLTISKAAGSAVSALTISGTPTANSITVNTVTLTTTATAQPIEYAYNTANSAPTVASSWSTTTRTFSGLNANTTYYFFARSQESANYNAGNPSTVSRATAPAAPGTPTATAVSTSSITVSWTAVTGATGYRVYRSETSGGSYSKVGSDIASGTTSYTDTNLTASKAYYYKVAAFNASAEGAQSAYATATTMSPVQAINIAAIPGVTIPDPGVPRPTAITATAQYTGTIAWTINGNAFTQANFYNTAGDVYTATITLTPTSGYTLIGVTANFFTVSGATSVTYTAGSSTITAVFPPTATYVITGNTTSGFTATKAGETVGTANQPIQTVINAIRPTSGTPGRIVQFGDGTNVLNIGTNSAQFVMDGTSRWATTTLTGKITSSNSTATEGTVWIGTNATINLTSEAEIINTATGGNALYIGTVVNGVFIKNGTLTATSTGYALKSTYANGFVYLCGSPTISGRIQPAVSATGNSTLYTGFFDDPDFVFTPGAKTYTLDFATYANGAIAVNEGGTFASNFTLSGAPAGTSLAVNGGNLVINAPPNGTESRPWSLLNGIWRGSIITYDISERWYTFNVTSGTEYYFWFETSSPGYVQYSAYYDSGSSIFVNQDGASKSFTASSTGNVKIKVFTPFPNTGNYQYDVAYSSGTNPFLKPGKGTEADPIRITEIVNGSGPFWIDGSITTTASGSAIWYTMDPYTSTQYYVWWNDKKEGDTTKTLDIKVSATRNDGTSIFASIDSAWTTRQTFLSNGTTVKFKVEPFTNATTGSFSIAVRTSDTRP